MSSADRARFWAASPRAAREDTKTQRGHDRMMTAMILSGAFEAPERQLPWPLTTSPIIADAHSVWGLLGSVRVNGQAAFPPVNRCFGAELGVKEVVR